MTRDIGVDANIAKIRLAKQGSNPATPTSGYGYLFAKSDGVYFKDDAGTVTGPFSTGSGGITQSYLGYNTIGGSTETMTNNRVYLKKITMATAGLINSIDAHVIGTSSADLVGSLACAVFSDNAGTPNLVLTSSQITQFTVLMDIASGAGGGGELNARWLQTPMGVWLPAADYWIAVMTTAGASRVDIHYDGSGSDHYYTSGGWFADHGFYAETTSANKYSIRASILR